MRSMKRSWVSLVVVVIDHARLSLCPSTTVGTPGSVPPTTLPAGVDTCARYQSAGACNPRCGSLASSGLPLSLRDPATTQLLEPTASSGNGYAASNARAAGSISAYSALKSGTAQGSS